MEVKVLGTVYNLQEVPKTDDTVLENNDGYCDTSVKKVVVDERKETRNEGKSAVLPATGEAT